MAEKLVGKLSEFKDGDRRIVFIGDHEIGVFREHGTFYAYSNYCLHQGGPACEGLTIAKVEERIMPDKTSKGLYFSDTELHFVCPWHGYEYDIKTGECVSDRKLKLRKYEVFQKGDEVYVRTYGGDSEGGDGAGGGGEIRGQANSAPQSSRAVGNGADGPIRPRR
jgi:nitrite reductase/ring-hydroxylating ferredoxin subunit